MNVICSARRERYRSVELGFHGEASRPHGGAKANFAFGWLAVADHPGIARLLRERPLSSTHWAPRHRQSHGTAATLRTSARRHSPRSSLARARNKGRGRAGGANTLRPRKGSNAPDPHPVPHPLPIPGSVLRLRSEPSARHWAAWTADGKDVRQVGKQTARRGRRASHHRLKLLAGSVRSDQAHATRRGHRVILAPRALEALKDITRTA